MDLYGEMGITDKVRAVDAELRRLKVETMGYTHVSAEGSVVVDSCPELEALQAQISAREVKLLTVASLKDQIVTLLGEQSADSIRSLQAAKERHANTIQSNPVRAWDLFRMKKELAIEQGNAAVLTAMPSELPELLTGYQDAEDALKAELVASQAAIVTITAALESIAGLTEDARAALSA